MAQRHHGILRLLGMRAALAANLALAAFVAWGFSGEYARNRALQQDIVRLQQESVDLAERNRLLASSATAFASPDTVEREARLKLGLQKPGENVVVVEASIRRERRDGGGAAPVLERESNAAKWWEYFFH